MTHMFRFDGPSVPSAPGQVLKEKLIDGMQLSQAQLARALGISCPRLNMILKGRCQISPEIALRIERVFDISPFFWLRTRYEFELFEQRQRMTSELDRLGQRSGRQEPETAAWRGRSWQAAA